MPNYKTTLVNIARIVNIDSVTYLPTTVKVANLGTGTPDNTKYLRGDGVWSVVLGGNNVRVINFLSSPTPSAGQTFTDSNLSNYSSADLLSVTVNGAVFNRSNYSLNGSTLTITGYLIPNSVIQIQPSFIANTP
jgi:hypothetical protein